MKIHFINHACLVIENDEISIICDPWIEGRVFDRGWDLIVPSSIGYDDFARFTHIWFSHEHPDHFFPPNIVKIPKDIRARLIVLFQYTEDKRVVDFCKKQGFKEVIELMPDQWLQIGSHTKVMCENYTEGDSWLAIQDQHETILNTNDCEINNTKDAQSILKKIGGKVDILLAQFSYACWAGNIDDHAFRKKLARSKLDIFLLQIREFAPSIAIPIASYVWFCHEENFYLNHGVNTPDVVLLESSKIPSTQTVILYPGESFQIGDKHDNDISVQKWLKSYESVLHSDNATLEKTKTIDETELIQEANLFANSLKTDFGIKTKLLKSAKIYINDYQKAYTLSVKKGLTPVAVDKQDCDIALSSDALLFCLKFPYGQDTLGVNGRFQKPARGNYNRFYNLFRFSQLKSRGIEVDFSYLVNVAIRKLTGANK